MMNKLETQCEHYKKHVVEMNIIFSPHFAHIVALLFALIFTTAQFPDKFPPIARLLKQPNCYFSTKDIGNAKLYGQFDVRM